MTLVELLTGGAEAARQLQVIAPIVGVVGAALGIACLAWSAGLLPRKR